ncbi:signal peptidase I [Ruminococcus sp.]|uniref:signal peptidase I n=1 Tax=Ruminococcus sp. TaxID=41978 RepID=UPI0025CDF206|nr:signal peptidase I [Ruminococcus sp.]
MSTIAKEVKVKNNSKGFYVYTIVRKFFIYGLSVFIIVAAIFFAASRSPNKSLFGFRYYIVLTDSMVPEFSSGDMVFVKRTGAEAINEGDIITFNPSSGSDAYLTHRVTEKIANYENTGVICFRTKGDANDSEDSFLIDESRVIGKVKFHVPKLGIIVRFVQLRWYFILPLIILLFVFFRMMKYYFDLKGKENSNNINQNIASEQKNN